MAIPTFLKKLARAILPRELEERLGITPTEALRFEVGAGLTPEQKIKAEEVVRKEVVPVGREPEFTEPSLYRAVKAAQELEAKGEEVPPELAKIAETGREKIRRTAEAGVFGFMTPAPKAIVPKATEVLKNPIKLLNEALAKAKPLRGRLQTAYTHERARRVAEVERAITEVGGEKGYATALSKLKGTLKPGEKVNFEPLKEKLTKETIDDLYNQTFKHSYLDNFEKISTADGLTKMLAGELPQPKQLVLMEEVYGTDMIKGLLSKRALGLKAKDVAVEVANIPRALLATADMSAFLRQGVIPAVAHPVIATKAAAKTFQFAFSPKAFNQYFKDLTKDPLYRLMRNSKLGITDPSRALATGREEAFVSRILQKVPVVGQVVKFAERSYVGFLNKLRVDVFKSWADELLSKGLSPVKDADVFKAAANVVNNFTGRGSLGKLDRITPELNTLFFSPRLIAARFNALNPVWYGKMAVDPRTRPIALKAISDFGKFVAAGVSTLALIKASKLAEVETDSRSADWGKGRIGNTRFDIWGGFQQWARVFAQIITGQRKNTTTGEIVSLTKDEFPFTTRYETLLRFVEGKLAPVPALMKELIAGGKTFEGEEITPEVIAREKLIPMYIQDITDAFKEGGLGRSIGAGTAAFFGVGVQTYAPKKREFKVKDYTKPSFVPSFKVKNYMTK